MTLRSSQSAQGKGSGRRLKWHRERVGLGIILLAMFGGIGTVFGLRIALPLYKQWKVLQTCAQTHACPYWPNPLELSNATSILNSEFYFGLAVAAVGIAVLFYSLFEIIRE